MTVIIIPPDHLETLLQWSNGPHRIVPIETDIGLIVGAHVLLHPAYEDMVPVLQAYEQADYTPPEVEIDAI